MIDNDYSKKAFMVKSAVKNNVNNRDEIKLFETLNLTLELINEGNFNLLDADINENGIFFGIATKYPHALPDKIGILFFNIDKRFKVNIKETSKCVYSGERYFAININKI